MLLRHVGDATVDIGSPSPSSLYGSSHVENTSVSKLEQCQEAELDLESDSSPGAKERLQDQDHAEMNGDTCDDIGKQVAPLLSHVEQRQLETILVDDDSLALDLGSMMLEETSTERQVSETRIDAEAEGFEDHFYEDDGNKLSFLKDDDDAVLRISQSTSLRNTNRSEHSDADDDNDEDTDGEDRLSWEDAIPCERNPCSKNGARTVEDEEFEVHFNFSSTANMTSINEDMRDWRHMRDICAQRRFHIVVRLGAILLGLGLAGVTGTIILKLLQHDSYLVIGGGSGVLLSAGWIIISTCPQSYLDLDLFVNTHRCSSQGLSLVLALMAILNISRRPHAHILPAAFALTEFSSIRKLLPRERRPLFTTFLVAWVLLFEVSSACAEMFAFAGDCGDGNQAFYEDCRPGNLKYLCSACTHFTVVLLTCIGFPRFRIRRPDVSPTIFVYEMTYCNMTAEGIRGVLFGVWRLTGSEGIHHRPHVAFGYLAYGLTLCVPIIVICVVGRRTLFNLLGRQFERSRSLQDGAFIAELLDRISVEEGTVWWVHHGREDTRWPQCDPRRNWDRGIVRQVCESGFEVAVPQSANKSPILHHLPLANRGAPAKELLTLAYESLRCIEFATLKLNRHEIFQRRSSAYKYSRDVQKNERIDYFMSHSWDDKHDTKWWKLEECASRFNEKYKHFPTFWLDCACIEQDRIADGLRVLPLYLMACNSVLILCGPSYPTRLWCVWELFTLVTISDHPAERVQFVSLTDSDGFLGDESLMVVKPAKSSQCLENLELLQSFDVRNAHCYDPNDEARILSVISSIGTSVFHARIRELVHQIAAKYGPSLMPSRQSAVNIAVGLLKTVLHRRSLRTSCTEVPAMHP